MPRLNINKLERVRPLKNNRNIKRILIFHNHKRQGGASIAHPRFQDMAWSIIPPNVQDKMRRVSAYSLRTWWKISPVWRVWETWSCRGVCGVLKTAKPSPENGGGAFKLIPLLINNKKPSRKRRFSVKKFVNQNYSILIFEPIKKE